MKKIFNIRLVLRFLIALVISSFLYYSFNVLTSNSHNLPTNYNNQQSNGIDVSKNSANKTSIQSIININSVYKPSRHHPNVPFTELSLLQQKIIMAPNCNLSNAENTVILIVLNRMSKFLQRQFIRTTYGNLSSFQNQVKWNWKIIFIIGKPVTRDEELFIQDEFTIFGDLLVTNVAEYYKTVPTKKLLIAFDYLDKKCPKVKYLVKTDDDVYIHIPKLENAIEGMYFIIEQFLSSRRQTYNLIE